MCQAQPGLHCKPQGDSSLGSDFGGPLFWWEPDWDSAGHSPGTRAVTEQVAEAGTAQGLRDQDITCLFVLLKINITNHFDTP